MGGLFLCFTKSVSQGERSCFRFSFCELFWIFFQQKREKFPYYRAFCKTVFGGLLFHNLWKTYDFFIVSHTIHRVFHNQMSRFCTYLAFCSINSRLGSTLSPISREKISLARL